MKSGIFIFLIIVFFLAISISTRTTSNQNKSSAPTATKPQTTTNMKWITFSDTKYHFEIKYPDNWTIDQTNSIINLQGPDGSITIDPTNSRKITVPVNTWINRQNQQLLNDPNRPPYSSPLTVVNYNHELKISDQVTALDDSFFEQEGKAYIIVHNHNPFYISYQYISESSIAGTIMESLSTFKFTEIK